ncbi:hypothetical protein [Geomicrobium sp. JCM 19038]|uniref:hypothetical protein n=1 Tax=Geomicrobium sp. JCM 19038 TaxID=1460635 RepID=UPI00045F319A|nr:hypothetical protein [Geomicrobium sp. JCM 19038]GAK08853.1 hypothetical protein JCM19038_2652 [Geomicrobium sp. JCM 19038]
MNSTKQHHILAHPFALDLVNASENEASEKEQRTYTTFLTSIGYVVGVVNVHIEMVPLQEENSEVSMMINEEKTYSLPSYIEAIQSIAHPGKKEDVAIYLSDVRIYPNLQVEHSYKLTHVTLYTDQIIGVIPGDFGQ